MMIWSPLHLEMQSRGSRQSLAADPTCKGMSISWFLAGQVLVRPMSYTAAAAASSEARLLSSRRNWVRLLYVSLKACG